MLLSLGHILPPPCEGGAFFSRAFAVDNFTRLSVYMRFNAIVRDEYRGKSRAPKIFVMTYFIIVIAVIHITLILIMLVIVIHIIDVLLPCFSVGPLDRIFRAISALNIGRL